ncbi:MAG: DUF937 domain-containing protein [Cellvibrionales bacterium]|nr:DUF937 domain-containing protein [Cellvibrionales bacterium]
MTSLVDSILGAANKSNLSDLAAHFGVDEGKIKETMEQVLPSLTDGLKAHVKQSPNSELIQNSSQAEQYIDDDNAKLTSDEAIHTGQAAVSALVGDQAKLDDIAKQASAKTGMEEDAIQKLIPMAATMFMGSASKIAGGKGASGLLAMLDQNQDGSVMDDIMGFAKGLFNKSRH